MANYRYNPDDIDDNSRRYAENQVLAASDQVLDLVRQLPAAANTRRTHEPAATNPVITRWTRLPVRLRRLVAVPDYTALTLWRPLLPYGYSYKASCARPD